MNTLDTAAYNYPYVPEDLLVPGDVQLSGYERERLRTVEVGDYLGNYFGNQQVQLELLAQEKAAGRLAVGHLATIDGVVLGTLRAQCRLDGTAVRTPLIDVNGLVGIERINVSLKHEGLQGVGSYKIRGAYGAMTTKLPFMKSKKVVTKSAGNHGRGFVESADRLGLEPVVFMPLGTPDSKRGPIVASGATVFETGNHLGETTVAYEEYKRQNPDVTDIPPYDDLDVVLHQGTMAAEILQQETSRTNYIFVPTGGGGALAGIAQFIKAVRPDIKVIGVEPDGCDSMTRSRNAGKRIALDSVDTFAEGVAVLEPGEIPFDIAQRDVDGMVVVPRRNLARAVCVLTDAGLRAEGAGALAFAGIHQYFSEHPAESGNVVGILSGRNIDDDKLSLARQLAA